MSSTVSITDTVTPAKMKLRLLVKRETSFKELLDQCLDMLGLSQGDADDARYIICDAGGTMFPHAARVLQELQHSGGTPDLFLNLRHRLQEKELQSFFPGNTLLEKPPRSCRCTASTYPAMRRLTHGAAPHHPEVDQDETLLQRIQHFDDVLNTPRLLFRDFGIFLIFMGVFAYVLFYRRDVKTVFTVNHFIEEQLVAQPFGKYMQLSMTDVATPDHVWEVRNPPSSTSRSTPSQSVPSAVAGRAVDAGAAARLSLHHSLLRGGQLSHRGRLGSEHAPRGSCPRSPKPRAAPLLHRPQQRGGS